VQRPPCADDAGTAGFSLVGFRAALASAVGVSVPCWADFLAVIDNALNPDETVRFRHEMVSAETIFSGMFPEYVARSAFSALNQ
jgi:hypothetical protein